MPARPINPQPGIGTLSNRSPQASRSQAVELGFLGED